MVLLSFLACTSGEGDTGEALPDRVSARPFTQLGTPTQTFDRLHEEGRARGLDWQHAGLPVDAPWAIGVSLVASDLDGDGDIDLAIGNAAGEPWRFDNDGTAHFTSRAPVLEWATDYRDLVTGLAAVDLNDDRLPELILLSAGRVQVMDNLGDLNFADPRDLWRDDRETVATHFSVGVGDVDADGDLDLVLPGLDLVTGPDDRALVTENGLPGSEALLLRWEGEGFVAERPWPGPEAVGFSFVGLPTDLDGDGVVEVMLTSDRAEPPLRALGQLWTHTEAGWQEDAEARGLSLDVDVMGIASWDWNHDGQLDHVVSQLGRPVALQSDGDRYVQAEAALGLAVPLPTALLPYWLGWSVEAMDVENDGSVDLAMAAGWAVNPPEELLPLPQPNALWRGHGDEGFEERAQYVGFNGAGHHYGLVAADLDGDGAVELVMTGLDGAELWIGPSTVGTSAELVLVGPPGNRHGLGARVRVEAGGVVVEREIRGPRALAQSPPRLLVGLGEAERVDVVQVSWPDGHQDRWTDLPVGHQLRLSHPEAP